MTVIGNAVLLGALALALYGGAAFVLGARWRSPRLLDSAARAVVAHFVLVTLVFVVLEYALVVSDFSLKYVNAYFIGLTPEWLLERL